MVLQEYAYAKINLFLDVLQRRPDGYHDIGTLFQTIDAFDLLEVSSRNDSNVVLQYDKPQEYPVESDLVYRAAMLFRNHFGIDSGVDLYLQKRLPMGAGLGGGSADAAATLRVLARLWNIAVSPTQLESMGAQLGADVPFLVRGGSALATGIGDVLLSISGGVQLAPGYCVVVGTPHCAVPTKAAYAGIQPSGHHRWNAYLAGLGINEPRQNQSAAVADREIIPFDEKMPLFNKFEESVLPEFPAIAQLRMELSQCDGCCGALMSGSGASVFAIFESEETGRMAMEQKKDQLRWSHLGFFRTAFSF